MKFDLISKSSTNPRSTYQGSVNQNNIQSNQSNQKDFFVASEQLILPESIEREYLQQFNLQKTWYNNSLQPTDRLNNVSGWNKQTLGTFRQSLDDKKATIERYLDKPSKYKKLACLSKPPIEFMLDDKRHANNCKNQQIRQSYQPFQSKDQEKQRSQTLPAFGKNANLSKSYNFTPKDKNIEKKEPKDTAEEVIFENNSEQEQELHQNSFKINALQIAMRKTNTTERTSPRLYLRNDDRQSLMKTGFIFVAPVSRQKSKYIDESEAQINRREDTDIRAYPQKTFNFKFMDFGQTATKDTLTDRISKKFQNLTFDLSQTVQGINSMKKKKTFTNEELFSLKGVTTQPQIGSDEYLIQKFNLEIQAANEQPLSLEENLEELDRIQQRIAVSTRQLEEQKLKNRFDYGCFHEQVLSIVPKSKRVSQILNEIELIRQKTNKISSLGLQPSNSNYSSFPDAKKLKALLMELNISRLEELALKITNNQVKVKVQMDIRNEKTSFLDQVKTSQVDRYVNQMTSNVSQTLQKMNTARTGFVAKLKKSLIKNADKQFEWEDERQAVKAQLKKKDASAFGVGFEEFQLMCKADIEKTNGEIKSLSQSVNQVQKFKNAQGAKITELNPTDPKFQFLKQCQEDLDICLPLLDKIIDQKIALYSYTLTDAHIKGLANVSKHLNGKVNGFVIEKCGLSDSQLAAILDGFSELNDFKTFSCKQNSLDEKSLKALVSLLNKAKPDQLTELQLIDCKIGARITQNLVHEISIKCHLEKLTLVHCNMTETSFKYLYDVIDYAHHFYQLNISWCEVQSKETFYTLFDKLSQNSSLTHLNLSYNSLFDTKIVSEDGEITKQTLDSIKNLCAFIRKNTSLCHLDLSYTGLSASLITQIVQAVKESDSIMAIHLCGNPGLSRELIYEIAKMLGSKDPFMPENHITNLSKKNDGDLNSYTVQETLTLKSELKRKKLYEVDLGIESNVFAKKQKLIIERQNSLSHLIPESKVWRMITQQHRNCFVCDQHIIGIFFWSKELHRMQTNPVDKDTKMYYENKTQVLYDQADLKQKLPTLQASFTNWEPVQLLELSQLCLQINNVTEPDWFQFLLNKDMLRYNIKCYADMNERELNLIEQKKVEFRLQQLQEWPRTLIDGIQPYKKAQLVNGIALGEAITSGSIDLFTQPVYCGVFFMKAGRQHFVVRHQEESYVFKEIVKFREEQVQN